MGFVRSRGDGWTRRLRRLSTVTIAAASVAAACAATAGAKGGALPDLRIFVPKQLISIGIDSSTGARELRFTHITADIGAGPFEIDPSYDARTGISTFKQAIYRLRGPGSWVLDRTVPIAATGEWHPPSDYQFPLTAFTLDRINRDGSPGAVVATSPKTDYCITGDTIVKGVPDTPAQTFISPSNCEDPTKPLGWSVGWGDEYDQTDAGQPIALTRVPNGTYILRAVVDPRHVFTESDTANDVTDTTLRIAGDRVTVLGQSNPGATPPSVTITSPSSGTTVSGSVALRALASAHAPATVRSVRFLLDGRPLGPAEARAPYRYLWTVGATAPGRHWLSAEVTDSRGELATARPVRIRVVRGPPLQVLRVRWKRGVLSLRLGVVAAGASVRAQLQYPGGRRSRSLELHGRAPQLRTSRPRIVILTLSQHGHQVGGALTLRLDERPAVSISNPVRGEIVSGIVPVVADAAGGTPIARVRFALDGRPLGRAARRAPFAIEWDTRRLRRGRHTLSAQVEDVAGHRAVAQVPITVENPRPPMTCFVMQAKLNTRGLGVATTPAFDTLQHAETVLALVSADGPAGPRQQSATVRGGGLRWRLVTRADRSYGDSEIWAAAATRPVRGARVTSTLIQRGYNESLTVVAVEGADGVGAAAAAGGSSGQPSLELRTLSATSLLFAAGNDWDRASARALPTGWIMLNQWLNTSTEDTFWSQTTNQPTGPAHSQIRVTAGGPAGDHWNLAAAELINDGD